MKKKLFKVQVIVSQRFTPTCKEEDCDIKENPEHWVDVELTPEYKLAPELFEELKRLHDEVGTLCNGEEDCPTCRIIAKAEGKNEKKAKS